MGFASRRVADGRIESGWSSEGLGQAVKLTGKSTPRAAKGSSGSLPFPPLPHIGAKRVAIDAVKPMSAKASDNVSATAFSEPGFIPPLEASVNRIPLAELWQDHTIAIQNVTAEASQKNDRATLLGTATAPPGLRLDRYASLSEYATKLGSGRRAQECLPENQA